MARRKGPSLSVRDVVSAAIKVVETEGSDAPGISRVASELKIKPASMYNHVRSGEALAKAVALEGNRRILEALTAEISDVTDPRKQLSSLAHAVRRWAINNGGLYAHMARVEPDYANADAAVVLDGILALFDQPLEALGVAGNERVHAMRSIRSALHGFVILETSGQFQLQEVVDDSFRWMVDGLIDGIVGRSAG